MFAFLLLASATDVAPIEPAVEEAIDALECKQRAGSTEIVVCANRNRTERYRMPDRDGPFDPDGAMKSVMNERVGWISEGDVGTQSCGVVGVGSWTGCLLKDWKVARDQTQWGKNVPKRRW